MGRAAGGRVCGSRSGIREVNGPAAGKVYPTSKTSDARGALREASSNRAGLRRTPKRVHCRVGIMPERWCDENRLDGQIVGLVPRTISMTPPGRVSPTIPALASPRRCNGIDSAHRLGLVALTSPRSVEPGQPGERKETCAGDARASSSTRRHSDRRAGWLNWGHTCGPGH
jgi:hypothetical protein